MTPTEWDDYEEQQREQAQAEVYAARVCAELRRQMHREEDK